MGELLLIKRTIVAMIIEYRKQNILTERDNGALDGLNITLGIVTSLIEIKRAKSKTEKIRKIKKERTNTL